MTERIKIDIVIDGRNFTVVGTESREYVLQLAQYVDKKIRELSSKNDKLCQTMSATLAALNIGDELYKTRTRLEDLEIASKEPMAQHDSLVNELARSENIIKELGDQLDKYKKEIDKEKQERQNLEKEYKNSCQTIDIKEKELLENQRMIKSLQDKIFDNQMELIETKKELEEVSRILNDENPLAKEDLYKN